MSDTPSLTDIISESLPQNPEVQDNLVEEEVIEEVDPDEEFMRKLVSDSDEETDEDEDDLSEFLDDLDEEDEDGGEDEASDDLEVFEVKVDGEVVEVTVDELKAGYQRQADYTRKAQALAQERQEFQESVKEFSDTISTLAQLDSAWDENPVQVLAHFTANTENPTQAVALLIKELAVNDLLDRDFLETFGITPDVRKAWSSEAEVSSLRRKAQQFDSERASREEEEEHNRDVEKAIRAFDRQIDEILEDEGWELSDKQRLAFRAKVAAYAQDNQITNLKAAYKAMKFEDLEAKRKLAAKGAERAKQKKAASVVGRAGSGAAGSASVSDNETDLTSIIRQAMKEAGTA